MYSQLLMLFALLFTGFFLRRVGIFNDEVNLGINKMIIFFAFPCLIALKIGTIQMQGTLVRDFLMVVIFGLASFVLFTVIAHAYYRIRGLKGKVNRPTVLCTAMPNNGFLGYPVTLVFLGPIGLLMMIAHGAVVFNIYSYTYAINYLRGESEGKIEMTPKHVRLMIRQVLLNPNIVAMVVGIAILVCGISLDNMVGVYLEKIADMASPLAMIYVGSAMAENKIKEIFTDRIAWEATLVILVIIPLITGLCVWWLPLSDLVKAILILGASFPAAALPIMLGQQQGLDISQASKVIFLSTMLSMITLPIIMKFLETGLTI